MKTFLFLIAGFLGLAADAFAVEVRLEDCPAAVQQTIRAGSSGGRIDEIDFLPASAKYVVEIDLSQSRDLTLEIASGGKLVRRVEDIRRGQLPKAVKWTVRELLGTTGRIDEIERETASRRVVYRVEIDFPNDRNQWFAISKKGVVVKSGSGK